MATWERTLEPGKEPIPVWAVGRGYEPCRAWAFYSAERGGWAVYDGGGMVLPEISMEGCPERLPDGVFQTREEALDHALWLAERAKHDLEVNEPKRLDKIRLELEEAIGRLEREVSLG